MKSIIVGGGKIGYNLFKTLEETEHDVVLIEKIKDQCIKIAEEIGKDVICGDGTDIEVLRDAGIEEAEIVAAVTGTDEENLVICQIAKMSFQTQKTIARVNNPKNIKMFKQLGIDSTVCSTEVIANLVEYELNKEEYRILSTFERGSMILVELLVDSKNIWCNQRVKELDLPEECVFVSVLRGDKVVYPKGDTRIEENDKVVFITNHAVLTELINKIRGGNRKWKRQ